MPATEPCKDGEDPYWNCIPLDPTMSPQPQSRIVQHIIQQYHINQPYQVGLL